MNNEIKGVIYVIFKLYETWKLENGYYDFMDVVNYVLKYISINKVILP